MTEFQDHFSAHAECYARSRPTYPPELFAFLTGLVREHHLAWDVGTGNGQAALWLARHFEKVIATDGSAEQIKHATPHERIEYRVTLAEDARIDAGTVDLVTIAQALHWFTLERFYEKVRLAAKPEGIIAAWCYDIPRVNPTIDAVCDHLYRDITGPYWPGDRKWIDEKFQTIWFPFEEIRPTPIFHCTASWTMSEYADYLESWSAVQRFRKDRGSSPTQLIAADLEKAWEGSQRNIVKWPIYMRVGFARSMK
jgi:SAM-dependent methyltransferase